jgi:hypothetical protein
LISRAFHTIISPMRGVADSTTIAVAVLAGAPQVARHAPSAFGPDPASRRAA